MQRKPTLFIRYGTYLSSDCDRSLHLLGCLLLCDHRPRLVEGQPRRLRKFLRLHSVGHCSVSDCTTCRVYRHSVMMSQHHFCVVEIVVLVSSRVVLHQESRRVDCIGMVLHAQRLWSLAVVASLLSVSIALPSRVSIAVEGSTLLVDGAPFFMKGVAYSPVPRGADVKQHWPFADYFIPEYEYIWNRDFPLLRAMGANTIRIYHWIPDQDHTLFLDIAHKHGLKVLITYDLRTTKTNPVVTAAQRQTIVNAFVEQVDRYKAHPALLMWIFGNELNGPWNGFLANMGQAFGCNADPHCMPARDGPAAADAAPCTPEGADEWATGVLVPCCAGLSVRNEAGKLICRAGPPAPPPGPPAPGCNSCWPHLFEWIDSALAAAKKADPARPITTALVDMGEDFLRDVVNASAPNLDVWGVNMYCWALSSVGPT